MRLNATLLKWIREQKIESGMSQSEMARRSKISQPQWSLILKGVPATLSEDTVDSLCELFGVTRGELVEASESVMMNAGSPDVVRKTSEAVDLYNWLSRQPELLIAIHNAGYQGSLPVPKKSREENG